MSTEANRYPERAYMVQHQIMSRGIHDEPLLNALRRVPRHQFVPPDQAPAAYQDRPLPIGLGQTISQPYMVALMTEALHLTGDENVLEVGTGSGYQAAILGELARQITTIERHAPLADRTQRLLQDLGYANVTVVTGDGTLGWPASAPYDAILVTAGAPHIPSALQAQLADGGRLVIPVGSSGFQNLVRLTRHGPRFDQEDLGGCVFVPLIGKQGWGEDERRGWW
ncbi:MAG: protein-L-isoaspartate(D-aspartate) O-methyltransferase [Chloroflexi bacterium]|nr:protein-L-isoaspartate(D-aspartate) O-methyltransferase [Chloroflexota bacterium]MBU1750694.1 protein-L-isoaspartate(D-aspartate) O-methyltransferase [Chloroflexota bacterium]